MRGRAGPLSLSYGTSGSGQTQWPGFADSGNDILGLSRNLGEVYAGCLPSTARRRIGGTCSALDYLNENSGELHGLNALEGW